MTPLSHGKLIIEWVANKFHDLEQSKANWVQIGPKFERFGDIMTRLILVSAEEESARIDQWNKEKRSHCEKCRISERMCCEESDIFSKSLHKSPMIHKITRPFGTKSLSFGKILT